MTKEKILIATGGTGGHVFPAYSLANYLIKKNFNVKLTVDKRGSKFLKDYKNLDLKIITTSPLNRKNFFTLLLALFKNVFSIIRSVIFLLFNRPAIIFGMGGYSSFPICIAASILRIKFIIYENNLIIGKANKYLLPLAKKIFVSYKEVQGISKKYNYKIIKIGNLIREDILNSNFKSEANRFDSLKVLVLGGSQAAKIFAEKLPEIFVKLKKTGMKIKVFQQCQKDQNDNLINFYKKNEISNEIFNFTDKIIDYYNKSNLVVTRSGASVLGELVNCKVPFISIPLPSSADNHQYKNAEFYKKKEFGYLVEEKDIEIKLYDLIKSLFSDKLTLDKILLNQRQYSDKDIFINLNAELVKILNEKN